MMLLSSRVVVLAVTLACLSVDAEFVCIDGECVAAAVETDGVSEEVCGAFCHSNHQFQRRDATDTPTFTTSNSSLYIKLQSDKDAYIMLGGQEEDNALPIYNSIVTLQQKVSELENTVRNLTALSEYLFDVNDQQAKTNDALWEAVNANKEATNANKGGVIINAENIKTNIENLETDEDNIVANSQKSLANEKKANLNTLLSNKNKEAVAAVNERVTSVNDSLGSSQVGLLAVVGAGGCDGNYVEVTVDGSKQSRMNGRGIHLYILTTTPKLAVVSKKVFDTHASKPATQALTKLLNSLPEGTVIAMGIKDEGMSTLDAAFFTAVENFGARLFRSLVYREGIAFIGIKGAPMGSTAQDDGGTSTGGTPKANCGGAGKAASCSQMIYVDRLSASNLIGAKASTRFKTGALAGVIDNHRTVHSGIFRGGGNWPSCTDKTGFVPIARVFRGSYWRYIRIWVIGSHRGHSRTSYMELEEDIITCGDKCSSYQLQRRGTHKVQLWNSIKRRPQTEYTGVGDVDIPGGGFMIMLAVTPQCGANLDYSYRVEISSEHPASLHDGSIELDPTECWNFRGNVNTAGPYYAKNC